MAVKRPSGVRRYQRRTIWQRICQWRACKGVALVGKHVYVEPGVHIMRHPERLRLENHVVLKSGARLCPTNPDAEISVGKWTTIGYHTYLFATTSIKIGNNCLIAPFVYIVDANHGIRRNSLIKDQDLTAAPIVINDDVWIGTNAVILKGVSIGRGAVISAGAIVSTSVPDFAVVAGNPAQIVDQRR